MIGPAHRPAGSTALQGNAREPRKRVAADVIVRDEHDRLRLVHASANTRLQPCRNLPIAAVKRQRRCQVAHGDRTSPLSSYFPRIKGGGDGCAT
jgi:hypothetical protein